MIVSEPVTPSRLLPPPPTDFTGPHRTWRCLARRGMLHSECESFEQLRLTPGATWTHEPDHGTEAALYVVAGSGSVLAITGTGTDTRAQPLDAGGALLVSSRAGVRVTAGAEGLDLLAVRVLPADVTAWLPARVPELPERQQTPIFRPPGDGH